MKADCAADISMIRLLICGALSFYENEGSQIFRILNQQETRYHARVFDHIGTALLYANDKLEEILEAPQIEEKA